VILRERITVTRQIDTGRTDAHGNIIYESVEVPYRAEVSPLQSDEYFKGGTQFDKSRLRVTLPASATDLGTDSSLTWRGTVYAFEGTPQPHVIGGRIHHHELIVSTI